MIVVLLNSYIALLALFVWLRFIRSTCSGSCRRSSCCLPFSSACSSRWDGARHRDPRRCCAIRCRSSRQRASDVGPFRGHPQPPVLILGFWDAAVWVGSGGGD